MIAVPADPEKAVLAAPYLKAAEAAGTPTVVFIGSIDKPGGRIRDMVAALQDYAQHPIVLRQIPIRDGDTIIGAADLISERAWRYRHNQPSDLIELPQSVRAQEESARSELLEQFSDFDDWLLEELVEDHRPASGPLFEISSRITSGNKLISAFIGSAANGNGMTRLMKALRHEAPHVDRLRSRLAEATHGLGGEPLAVCVHAYHRQHAGKTTVIRALGEGVAQASALGGANVGVLMAGGDERKAEGGLAAGSVALAAKSDHLKAGTVLTRTSASVPHGVFRPLAPMYARVLTAASEKDETKLSAALERLAEDDPGMAALHAAGSGRLIACVQGPLHLRAVRQALADIFHVSVEEDAPRASFRETITKPTDEHYRHRKQTGGSGQFADVKLSVRPNGRDAGFSFEDTIKGGTVPSNYIPAVETGARDAMDRGPLGFPVIDVHVTLTDGQYHSVDSSDFAFRTAARMGVRAALEKCGPVLLQPIHRVEVHVPSVHSGALVPLVSSLHGQVLGFDRDPDAKGWDVFRALVPASALDGFVNALRSSSQGLGHYTSEFDHYEELYGKEAERIQREHAQAEAAH